MLRTIFWGGLSDPLIVDNLPSSQNGTYLLLCVNKSIGLRCRVSLMTSQARVEDVARINV